MRLVHSWLRRVLYKFHMFQALLEACWIENEPCTLQVIVRCVARCLNLEPSKVAQQCLDTANKIFKFLKVESSTFE